LPNRNTEWSGKTNRQYDYRRCLSETN